MDDAVYLGKMPRAVVEALEAGDFGFFNSPLYARSFLKQYGEYVGADVEPWLDDLVPMTMIDGTAVESFIDIADPIDAPKPRKKTKPKSSENSGTWGALWLLIITAGLIWGGMKIFQTFDAKLADVEADLAAKEQDESKENATEEEKPAVKTDAQSEEEIAAEQSNPEPPRRAIIVAEP